MNFFKKIFRKSNNDKLDKSLEKTSSSFIEKIKKVVVGKTKVDATTLDDLEEVLITSDVGVKTTLKIIDSIEERVKKEKYTNAQELGERRNEAYNNDERRYNVFLVDLVVHIPTVLVFIIVLL